MAKTFNVNDKVMWLKDIEDGSKWVAGIVTGTSDDGKSLCVEVENGIEYIESSCCMAFDEPTFNSTNDLVVPEVEKKKAINYKDAFENVYNDMCEIADIILGKDWGAEDAVDVSDISRQMVRAIKKKYYKMQQDLKKAKKRKGDDDDEDDFLANLDEEDIEDLQR